MNIFIMFLSRSHLFVDGYGYTFWTFWIIALHLLYKLWILNILAMSITEETCIVEMHIWCKKSGTVNFITVSVIHVSEPKLSLIVEHFVIPGIAYYTTWCCKHYHLIMLQHWVSLIALHFAIPGLSYLNVIGMNRTYAIVIIQIYANV